jgi:hypothetical protein
VPCRAVQHVLHERTQQLTQAGTTRHDSMLEATQRLAHLAAEGHTGIPAALAALHHLFTQAVTADGSRTSDDAQQEWDRALAGAIRNAATTPTSDTDPCTDPFMDDEHELDRAALLEHLRSGDYDGFIASPRGTYQYLLNRIERGDFDGPVRVTLF